MKILILVLIVISQSVVAADKRLILPDKLKDEGYVMWTSIVSIDGKHQKETGLTNKATELLRINGQWICGIQNEEKVTDETTTYVRQVTCANVKTKESVATFTTCGTKITSCEAYLALKTNGKNYGFFVSGKYIN